MAQRKLTDTTYIRFATQAFKHFFCFFEIIITTFLPFLSSCQTCYILFFLLFKFMASFFTNCCYIVTYIMYLHIYVYTHTDTYQVKRIYLLKYLAMIKIFKTFVLTFPNVHLRLTSGVILLCDGTQKCLAPF